MSWATPSSDLPKRLAWISPSDDPAEYSAVEEACLRDSRQDFFLLWINRPAVFVGKNQNLWAQVSAREAQRSGVSIHRRLSGGGTVYHDPGNLNFSLISSGEPRIAFREHLHLILPYFQARGIPVEIRNRSDLFQGDHKFSGNAEYFSGGRVLHHGTLLFDCDLDQLARLLTPHPGRYDGRAVESNPSPTVNLKHRLPQLTNTRAFAADLLAGLLAAHPNFERVEALPENLAEKAQQYRPRFEEDAWIYGRSPKYEFSRTSAGRCGERRCQMTVREGRFERVNLETDDASQALIRDLSSLANDLLGAYHKVESVESIINEANDRVKELCRDWIGLFF